VDRRLGRTRGGGHYRVGDHNFFYGKGNENHHRIVSEVNRVEYVSDRLPYIVLRGRLCNIIVLNVQTPGEVKSDNSKERFERN
jgi:hypothetical protein